MELKTLQKTGAYAIIIGAITFVVWTICWTFLLPREALTADFSLMVKDPDWIWINTIALPAMILTIFGFTAIYSRLYQTSGWLGLIGYIVITIAYIFQAAQLTWEIFLYPVIVAYEPAVPLLSENIMINHPLVTIFSIIFSASVLLGVLLFGIVLIRSKVFQKIGGILFLTGAILYAVGSMFTVYLGILGVLMFAAGCLILGINLMKPEL